MVEITNDLFGGNMNDKKRDVYERLVQHLSCLGMGYPPTETLIEILKENFSPKEAEVALAIPTRVMRGCGAGQVVELVEGSTSGL